MKNIFIFILILGTIYTNAYSDNGFCSDGTIEDVTDTIINNDFNDAGDGWARGWKLDGGLNSSNTYKAHGQYIFMWDKSYLRQTINIEPNTDYQIKFLGAYSVRNNAGKSDKYNRRYKGQAVRFTFSNGHYKKQKVKHWIFKKGRYFKKLYPYTVNLGNSGNSTKLTIKACAGGCRGAKHSFIKIDYFRLYKCKKGESLPPADPSPEPISITKKVKLTILNDDAKFLIVDSNGDKNHTKIQTKIVNKSFNINVLSVDENKNLKKNELFKDTYVRLIPSSSNCLNPNTTGITAWKKVDIYGKTKAENIPLVSSLANKDVKVQIKWKNNSLASCSLDNFAIRPDKFKIVLPSADIKAGDDFTFKIVAEDKMDKATSNYNEIKDNSFKITYNEKKSACSTGTIHFTKSKFVNGVFSDDKATYDNVGELGITVEEIPGKEFAYVDRGDTPDSLRYIKKDTVSKKFIPAKLDTIVKVTDAKSDITLYSKYPSLMAANINLQIKATTSSGSLLTNYKDSCYAKDVDLKITYNNSNTMDNHTIKADKTITERGTNYFKVKIPKSKFVSGGKATEDIKVNLDRDPKVAKNPNLFTVTQVDVSDGSITTTVNPTSNNKAHFYYARAHVPSPQTSDNNSMSPKVYYEVYCKGCNKSMFVEAAGKSSIDSVYWYILPSATIGTFGTSVCDYKSSSADLYAIDGSLISSLSHHDNTTIDIKASKVPSKNKIYYEPINSYLQYNKFGTALPKHYFDIIFTTSNTKWAGEGTKGTTVDTNISKKSNQSIDW